MTEKKKSFLRRVVRKSILFYVEDTLDGLRGRRNPLVPPRNLMYEGVQDAEVFLWQANAVAEQYKDRGGLTPSGRVLDVGCGIGRKTIGLIGWLKDGSYDGLDINATGINWCKKKIEAKHPNFRFHHADLYNSFYNPKGKYRASEYRFPFDDATFDLVVLGSVFTHMVTAEVRNYFAEIARVSKPGARNIITYFLINDESGRCLREGKSTIPFVKSEAHGGCWIGNFKKPENAVGYDEEEILSLYQQHGFRILPPTIYGNWSGREDRRDQKDYLQDVVFAEKM